MPAKLAQSVIYEGDILSNGTRVHPAVINRVWSDAEVEGQNKVAVNLMVFPDCGVPTWRTSVYLFADKEQADLHRFTSGMPDAPVCYFPE